MSLNRICCCLEIYLHKCPLTPGAINYRLFKIIRVVQLLYIFCCALWKLLSACLTVFESRKKNQSFVCVNPTVTNIELDKSIPRRTYHNVFIPYLLQSNKRIILSHPHKSLLNFLDLEIFSYNTSFYFPTNFVQTTFNPCHKIYDAS